jgi:hypothetical protein
MLRHESATRSPLYFDWFKFGTKIHLEDTSGCRSCYLARLQSENQLWPLFCAFTVCIQTHNYITYSLERNHLLIRRALEFTENASCLSIRHKEKTDVLPVVLIA